MRYNRLGHTGLFVSELCLGSMTFGNSPGRYAAAGNVSREDATAIMRRAMDAGINMIDTANVYAFGHAEEIVGHAIRDLGLARKDIVLATKAEHTMGPGPNDGGASRVHLMEAVKDSLRRLGTDHIDLFQLHGFDVATPVEETLRALGDLVQQGHVRYVGVCNWAAWQIAQALGKADRLDLPRFVTAQSYYSLAGRDIEREIVPLLESENLGLLAFSPLAGGYLTGKYRNGSSEGRRKTVPFPPVDDNRCAPVVERLCAIADTHDTTPGAVALAWTLARPAISSVIIGVKRIEQLDANLAATELRLTADEITSLNDVSALTPEYPAWMAAAGAARETLLRTGVLQDAH